MQKQGLLFSDADIISRYTRAQAIEDGVLADVSETSEFLELGYRVPVALTSAVLERCVEVPEGVILQDWHGRLWDRINFGVHVRNDNSAGTPPLVALKAVCGPGDDGEPTICVMLPFED